MTATATATKPAAQLNDYGFPIVDCYRCKGAGTYSWNARTGTTCFGCDGTGKTVRRGKAMKAWTAFIDAQPPRHLAVAKMVPGVQFKYREQLETVAYTELTTEPCGSQTTTYRDYAQEGAPQMVEFQQHYMVRVGLASGVVLTLPGTAGFPYVRTADMFPDPADFNQNLYTHR